MLVVETIARIRREHLDRGKSIRRLARELKLSRNTVRQAIRGDVAVFGYERSVQPLPELGPWSGVPGSGVRTVSPGSVLVPETS